MRSQVMEFVEQHESEWVQISAQTLTAQRKLAKVQGMVRGLGLGAESFQMDMEGTSHALA